VPTQNGHSLVAKRATSPKAPREQAKTGRAGSPLAQTSTTPSSPTSATKPLSHKRKAEEGGPPSEASAPKKRRRATVDGELEDSTVIDWLRKTPNASTRDCIDNFTPYIRDERKKAKFIALIKEIAQLKGGVLVLKNQYR
jgi:transcription initiation factor TFIIF subunit alpha